MQLGKISEWFKMAEPTRNSRHHQLKSMAYVLRRGARWHSSEILESRLLMAADTSGAIQLLDTVPALFVENRGQWPDSAGAFNYQGSGVTIGFNDSSLTFNLLQNNSQDLALQSARVTLGFKGANAVLPVGQDKSSATFNYLVGDKSSWQSKVSAYQTIAYNNLYPGINLKTFGQKNSLKYEFDIAPGGDYHQIQVHLQGMDSLSLAADGTLHIKTVAGELVDEAPFIYQVIAGKTVQVAGGYEILDNSTYTFAITGNYDATKELVVDPNILWSSYLSDSGNDDVQGVKVDSQGNALIIESKAFLPTVIDNPNGPTQWWIDATIVKYNSVGDILWTTRLGGNGGDTRGTGIALDGNDNILVTGDTRISSWISEGYNHTLTGGWNSFVAKLNSDGDMLWSTIMGGSKETTTGIVADHFGNVLVTGYTTTTPGNNWVSGGYNTTSSGTEEGFVVKLNGTGHPLWSTYVGGTDDWKCNSIAVDSADNVLVTGATEAQGLYGPPTPPGDAFVVKISSLGALIWTQYLGGSADDYGTGVAVDSADNVIVAGNTKSNGWVHGGYVTTINSGYTDGFVVKMNTTGQQLWSSYVGGSKDDNCAGIVVDSLDNILITGGMDTHHFTTISIDNMNANHTEATVIKITSAGQHIGTTFLGGNGHDWGTALAVDATGNVFAVGQSYGSSWVTDHGESITGSLFNGSSFVAKFMDPTAYLVTNLYQDLLGRDPDAEGMTHWMELLNHGTLTLAQVDSGFIYSLENFIKNIQGSYQKLLDRNPESTGLQNWINYLRAGHSFEQMKAEIIGSHEYYAHHGGNNRAVVSAMYHDLLGRSADESGQNHWTTVLDQGYTTTGVAYTIMTRTPEGAAAIVRNYYLTFLNRTPDPDGLNVWVNELRIGISGEAISIGFLSSLEYIRRD